MNPESMTALATRIDAFLADEADLDCPACDGSVERDEAGKLECDMCGRQWSDDDVLERNRRRLS